MNAKDAAGWAQGLIIVFLVVLVVMAALAFGVLNVSETTWDRLIAVLGSFQALVVVCAALVFAKPALAALGAAWGKAEKTDI